MSTNSQQTVEGEPNPQIKDVKLPNQGDLVHVRSRTWLVDDVTTSEVGSSLEVRLACADDDAQGQVLDVLWDYEIDARVLSSEGWEKLAEKGFDDSSVFSAFLHTMRWNCVTATDPGLFQSPFRAGIKIDAYQMEPLRKALLLPRVNLFIADDTGLGKTIEAGLIARELLLRKKVKTIVVATPPSVLDQWKGELEERFGLTFEILDRAYLTRMRRERGFGVNPWRTHSRFLVSHNLLADPAYAVTLEDWLGDHKPGSLLIIDEAHHAAPSSGGKYGIESKFTRAVRNLAPRFEHRLFLSATPHNGHSNSFSTLLELLDPYRFTRGVPVKGKTALEDVMVRRLKEDIRKVQGGFPRRDVVPVVCDDLPKDQPELVLSRLLDEYRSLRDKRYEGSSKRSRAAAGLLTVGLQQRLLSSIEAFARTLKVHRKTVERIWAKEVEEDLKEAGSVDMFITPPDADDDRSLWTEEEEVAEEAALVEAVTAQAELGASRSEDDEFRKDAIRLLDEMQRVAEDSRHLPDAKVLKFIEWIRSNMCSGLRVHGQEPNGTPEWNERRVIVFTESREGTKKYLRNMLDAAIESTDRADERIEVIDGLTSRNNRKILQKRFNTDPRKDPLRILIATDAAREGLNFQAYCTDLFHFDLPWNPGRIEQRNGRIDRKLQPADVVRCHYFILPQRVEDRVLEVLVTKTETIKKELGSLSNVIDRQINKKLKGGIKHSEADRIRSEIEEADLEESAKRTAQEELEDSRDRQEELKKQIERCRTMLDRSRSWTAFEPVAFRNALSSSLRLHGSSSLIETKDEDGRTVFEFPPLDKKAETDPSWASTLDTLREPRKSSQSLAEWRQDAPIRPVVFEDAGVLTEDVVHLHLDQRVAQRLLAKFKSQGFVHHDLSRACMGQARDSIPRIVLLARLSLFGHQAERLHEELVPVTARWVEPSQRSGGLKPYAADTEAKTLDLLDETLTSPKKQQVSEHVMAKLLESAKIDVEELLPHLEERAKVYAKKAEEKLAERGEREAQSLVEILERQTKRVEERLSKFKKDAKQFELDLGQESPLGKEELRQLRSDAKSWEIRLQQFKSDLDTEPGRIRSFYDVRATRIEPVGLVYLWPETN